MSWSIRLARIFGIDVRVHITFLLILAWGAIRGAGGGAAGAAFGVLTMVLLFLCVTLHELGHSVVAQSLGVRVREIVLLPIGGLARMERAPSKPWHELVIAIAGPLVNVLLAVLLFVTAYPVLGAGWLSTDTLALAASGSPSLAGMWMGLLVANIVLAVFNMIPALPMDGGRVLRSVLAMLFGQGRGTRIAAVIGQVLAAAMGVLAVMHGEILLGLIAMFVFLGAGQERAMVGVSEALSRLTAGDITDRDGPVLAANETLAAVAALALRSARTTIPVVHGERLIGAVSVPRVISLLQKRPDAERDYVTGVVERDLMEVGANDALDEVQRRMVSGSARVAAVVDDDGIAGIISLDDVMRAASIAQRLGPARARRTSSGAPTTQSTS